MCVSFNISKNKQQLFIGCGDGSLRSYPLDKQKHQRKNSRPDLYNEIKPYLFQWEESHVENDKQFKHDTIGTGKEEYPLWLSVVDLVETVTQYLVCFTEEGTVYTFDINGGEFPLQEIRLLAGRSRQDLTPLMVNLNGVKKGDLAICRGNEWSLLSTGEPIPSEQKP
jgi:hypothetical protein